MKGNLIPLFCLWKNIDMLLLPYVQNTLWISRRKFTSLIKDGAVFINWKKVESFRLELQNKDVLSITKWERKIDNHKISLKQAQTSLIIFNKPEWYVVSKSDPFNTTIYSILPKKYSNYFYIGRLDKNSRGLLLLTNNSKFVDYMSHPSNNIEKEYIVQVDRFPDKRDILTMKKWIMDDKELLQIKEWTFYQERTYFYFKLVLLEGKKRHIRRMLKKFRYKILDLQRVREWKYSLDNLKEGNFREVEI